MNHMAEVAKMLGVELGEEFEIEFPAPSTISTTVVFKENEFRIVKTDAYIMTPYWNYSVLHSLLVGSLTIKRKPWKPNDEERYWYVDERGRIWSDYFDYYSCASHCMNYYKLGNCYRTYEEAEANRYKWVAFYADGVAVNCFCNFADEQVEPQIEWGDDIDLNKWNCPASVWDKYFE